MWLCTRIADETPKDIGWTPTEEMKVENKEKEVVEERRKSGRGKNRKINKIKNRRRRKKCPREGTLKENWDQ